MNAAGATGVLLEALPVLHAICAWSLALLLAAAARNKATTVVRISLGLSSGDAKIKAADLKEA